MPPVHSLPTNRRGTPLRAGRGSHWLRIAATAFCFTIAFHAGCSSLQSSKNGDVVHVRSSTHHIAPKSEKAFQLGLKHYHAKRYDLAVDAFRRAIELDGANGRAHNNLGLIYFDQHRLASAASHFDSAAQLLPDEPSPLNNLGMALEAGGRELEALEYYDLAAQLAPNNPVYLGNYVRGKVRMGDESEQTRQLLMQLVMIEHRPSWRRWARDKLALEMNPMLDRGGDASPSLSDENDSSTTLAPPQNVGAVGEVVLGQEVYSDAAMQSGQSVVVPELESGQDYGDSFPSVGSESIGPRIIDSQDYYLAD